MVLALLPVPRTDPLADALGNPSEAEAKPCDHHTRTPTRNEVSGCSAVAARNPDAHDPRLPEPSQVIAGLASKKIKARLRRAGSLRAITVLKTLPARWRSVVAGPPQQLFLHQLMAAGVLDQRRELAVLEDVIQIREFLPSRARPVELTAELLQRHPSHRVLLHGTTVTLTPAVSSSYCKASKGPDATPGEDVGRTMTAGRTRPLGTRGRGSALPPFAWPPGPWLSRGTGLEPDRRARGNRIWNAA